MQNERGRSLIIVEETGNEALYSHIKEAYQNRETLGQRFVKYLSERDNPSPYTGEGLAIVTIGMVGNIASGEDGTTGKDPIYCSV